MYVESLSSRSPFELAPVRNQELPARDTQPMPLIVNRAHLVFFLSSLSRAELLRAKVDLEASALEDLVPHGWDDSDVR